MITLCLFLAAGILVGMNLNRLLDRSAQQKLYVSNEMMKHYKDRLYERLRELTTAHARCQVLEQISAALRSEIHDLKCDYISKLDRMRALAEEIK